MRGRNFMPADMRFHKAICMNVTTYEILNDKGEILISLIQKIINELMSYLPHSLEIYIELMNGRERNLKFNERNLKKVYDLLLAGEIETLGIGDASNDDSEVRHVDDPIVIRDYPALFSFAICCNQAATYPPHFSEKMIFPNDFNLSMSEQLFDNIIPMHIQQTFNELFKEVIVAINGVYGFITYETTAAASPMMTPYENYYALSTTFLPGFTKKIRGYFWNNYLSTDHIERLGGIQQVLSDAPCFVKEPLATSTHQGVLLQLTEDINYYSDDQLVQLRNYLLKLLELSNKYEMNGGEYRFFSFSSGVVARLVEP
jgi:hypothetical protein